MIERVITGQLTNLFRQYPFVTVTGPRQAGKTTLCRSTFGDAAYTSLESPDDRAFAEEDPRGFLQRLGTPAIIDEIQHVPMLLSYLQVIADEDGRNSLYVLTGSENLKLSDAVGQSLAGRTALLRLLPFSLEESRRAGASETFADVAFNGFYPRIVDQRLEPRQALGDYFETYVERDVRRMGGVGDLSAFRRFVSLCAGRVGQMLNLASLSGDVGVSHTAIRQWVTLLERSYVAFLLPPFAANIRKRLVKAPKLYFYDVGLASYLLGIESPGQVSTHPLRGSLFENVVVAEAAKHCYNRGREPRLSFFRDSRGLECDLFYETERGINAIEAKSGATIASNFARSLDRVAEVVPNVAAKTVVYGGSTAEEWGAREIVPLGQFDELLDAFDADKSVRVTSGGTPVAGVDILALFPNNVWQRARSDIAGVARLKLYTTDLPMTVFLAGERLSAGLVRDWVPAQGALEVELEGLADGGSVILADGTGHVPGIEGRLNPILDTAARTYLYTTNVAVNGGQTQPVPFAVGEDVLSLVDSQGSERELRIVAITGQSSLVEYRVP
ncbi:MAG: DUF4143 domain-containing protein [Acidimicrobiaceae bacterium]|nr:DUF4143 domain-containing protein [Acidimicrobiia bacterium]MCY4495250.1 DUF4143 domain-containing protein [Acidimicrobiaceae bacterium]